MKSDTARSYAYVIRVSFEQPVRPLVDPEIIQSAVTWQVSRLGTVEVAHLCDIRSDVADLVDKFIHAFREQNLGE